MSKVMRARRLGGAGSEGMSISTAVAAIPQIVGEQIRTKLCDKLICVHELCSKHKQLRTSVEKNGKLVQGIFSTREAAI